MTRTEETNLVKNALAKEGIRARVDHGKGTAWGWLHIYVGENPHQHTCPRHAREEATTNGFECDACTWYENTVGRTKQVAQHVTGRHGEYGGNINIYTQ